MKNKTKIPAFLAYRQAGVGMTIMVMLIGQVLAPITFAETITEDQLKTIKTEYIEPLYDNLAAEGVSTCADRLSNIYDSHLLGFLSFLEEHFTNKSSTSSLTNTAILRYQQYKKNIQEAFIIAKPKASSFEDVKTYEAEFSAYQKCSEITDAYLEMAKEHMIQHIKATGAQKKTTIMAEKLKSINNQLNGLNSQLAELFAFFVTFKNKLPRFTGTCESN